MPAATLAPSHNAPTAGTRLRIVVIGVPVPQGSKKAISVGGHARLVEAASDRHARWRNDVTIAALDAAAAAGQTAPLDGPLRLTVDFRFPMPANRPKATREAGRVWRMTAPDADKLVRAVGDALTAAAVIVDDARIAETYVRKLDVHGLWTGADITVEQLDPLEVP